MHKLTKNLKALADVVVLIERDAAKDIGTEFDAE